MFTQNFLSIFRAPEGIVQVHQVVVPDQVPDIVRHLLTAEGLPTTLLAQLEEALSVLQIAQDVL